MGLDARILESVSDESERKGATGEQLSLEQERLISFLCPCRWKILIPASCQFPVSRQPALNFSEGCATIHSLQWASPSPSPTPC